MDILEHEIRVTFRYPGLLQPRRLRVVEPAGAEGGAERGGAEAGADPVRAGRRRGGGASGAAERDRRSTAVTMRGRSSWPRRSWSCRAASSARTIPRTTERILQAIHDAALDRHSYVGGDRRRRGARRGRLRGGDGASRHPADSRPDHRAGAGRLGGRRQERHQRVRQEELPRHVRAAVRRHQRLRVPDDARPIATGAAACRKRSRPR